jgi:hypothetical protein
MTDHLDLPDVRDRTVRAWTVGTVGGHQLRVAWLPDRGAFVATITADRGSSPTNGEFVDASMFEWPMRLGEPVVASQTGSALDYWQRNAAFIEGPQAPRGDGAFGSEWVIETIEVDDLERERPVDNFNAGGALVQCWHGHGHETSHCACQCGCCSAGHVPSLSLRDAKGWWVVTTNSGSRYFILNGGRQAIRYSSRDESRIVFRSAEVTPSLLVVGGGSWRLDSMDRWMRPTGIRSIRRATKEELTDLGVEPQ